MLVANFANLLNLWHVRMKPDGKSKSDLSTRTWIFMSAFYPYKIHFKCTLYMHYLFSIIISKPRTLYVVQLNYQKIWIYFHLKFYCEMLQKIKSEMTCSVFLYLLSSHLCQSYCCFTLFFLRCFSIKFWQPTLQSKLNLVVKNLLLKSGGKMHIIMLCLIYLLWSFVL